MFVSRHIISMDVEYGLHVTLKGYHHVSKQKCESIGSANRW